MPKLEKDIVKAVMEIAEKGKTKEVTILDIFAICMNHFGYAVKKATFTGSIKEEENAITHHIPT